MVNLLAEVQSAAFTGKRFEIVDSDVFQQKPVVVRVRLDRETGGPRKDFF